MIRGDEMIGFLSVVDGILIILFFIIAFSFVLALVLWLVGIFGVTIWAVAKIFLAMITNLIVEILLVKLINKLDVEG